jgi:hypothetical protein
MRNIQMHMVAFFMLGLSPLGSYDFLIGKQDTVYA